MVFRNPFKGAGRVAGPPARECGPAPALRRWIGGWKVLVGAALMAAAGALAGAELRPEDLELRTARAPHLRVSGHGAGKAGVTIP